VPIKLSDWKVREGNNVPQQRGILDCGLYAAQFAKYCALDLPFFSTLDKEQTAWIRRMMAVEISDGRIRLPWD
jgi:Ulp1 family protease